MIMTKIMQEESKSKFNKVENYLYKSKISFRGTGLTIRKINHHSFQSYQQSYQKNQSLSPSKPNKELSFNTTDMSQQTCTAFMKNYIDKLKRQRKREKKKLQQFNHGKEQQGALGCNITSFPAIQHSKQSILMLQKMSPLTFRSNSIQPTKSTSTINNDQIMEIIREIRQQKQKIQEKVSLKKRVSNNVSHGLPFLEPRQTRSKIKINVIESLDPWQNTNDKQQMVFE